MKILNLKTTFSALLLMLCACTAQAHSVDETAIRQTVQTSYCNGAYNALDTVAMAKGFHPSFAIFGAEGEMVERYTIQEWITAIDTRKAKAGFQLSTAVRDCKVTMVDIAGGSAVAKVEVRKANKPQYTDYLSLLRLSNG